ncbi:MAG: methylmalonyl-CoA mutase family protein [Lentimicrobiaceae bacterium]|jgi:methylmalonyl-CoA mutase
MDQNTDKLFGTFPPVSTSDWEAHIMQDLKGAGYQKKLIWKTSEGFDVKPYYRDEDIRGLGNINSAPGEYPFIRGNQALSNNWEIRQDIETDDESEANLLAIDAIKRGATGIGMVASELESENDVQQLLKGINPTEVAIHFGAAPSYLALIKIVASHAKSQKLPIAKLRGSFDFDPISYLLLNGDFWKSEKYDLAQVASMVKLGKELMPAMKVINVNGHYFNSAGATMVQELGFSLASGNEYLVLATAAGIPVDDAALRMMFSFGIGSNYFMEIARLRAARLLWAKIVEQYQPIDSSSMQMHIHSNTSAWNKTLFDPYVNLLRSTTEAMSAIIGGTQSLNILPFDTFYKDPDEFSNRLARNQQIILKEEVYLDKVIDPAAGSYYIENLTQLIAEAAWKVFLQIEEKGGMVEAVKSGFVQDLVKKSAGLRLDDIANRRLIQLGTNQHPNPEEQMLEKIHFAEEDEMLEEEIYADEEMEVDEDDEDDEPTTYKKLVLFGGSDAFDQLRLATEQFVADGNKKPAVFLFNIGNLALRKARAMFSTNFFGCAGYEIIDNSGFESIEEGVKAAKASKAEIVVICSSDDEYATLVPEIAKKLKTANKELNLVVAGYPKEIMDSLKQAGVNEFIHVRSNLLQTLESFQEKLGVF